jgi:hypothetical protein
VQANFSGELSAEVAALFAKQLEPQGLGIVPSVLRQSLSLSSNGSGPRTFYPGIGVQIPAGTPSIVEEGIMPVQLSLSRAHKVVERLKTLAQEQSQLASQNLADTLVNGYAGDAQVESMTARASKGLSALTEYARLNSVLGDVRAQIGRANAAHGVGDLLARQETLSRQASLLQVILEQKDVGTLRPSDLQHYKPFNAGEQSMLRSPGVRVRMLSDDQSDQLARTLSGLRKEIFEISDKVADVNASRITLSLDNDLAQTLGLA